MNVHVICLRPRADRVLGRFGRYLESNNKWSLSDKPDPTATVNYMVNYADGWARYSDVKTKTAAWFTHPEEEPKKRALWDGAASSMDLRVTGCERYANELSSYGPTQHIPSPVERDRFIPKVKSKGNTVGVGGFARGPRKGVWMVAELAKRYPKFTWRASGEGWPVQCKGYSWTDMPGFYQSLDVFLCTSLIEGGPMGPIEALSCGVPVVVPEHVGLIDELPHMRGIYRYEAGNVDDCAKALCKALVSGGDPNELRRKTDQYSVPNWCERHRQVFEALL